MGGDFVLRGPKPFVIKSSCVRFHTVESRSLNGPLILLIILYYIIMYINNYVLQTLPNDPDSTFQRSHTVRFDNIMDCDVHRVSADATLQHLFQTFVNERLRHLVVVDDRNRVVGIVTRKDLAGLSHGHDKESSGWLGAFTAKPVVVAKNWFFAGNGMYKYERTCHQARGGGQ